MIPNNTFKKVGIASFIMMASVFASRLIGVFREMTIAGVGGIKSGVDAYQIAFVLPEILNHIVASGFLSITFIPIFTHYLTTDRPDEGYRVFSIIHNTFGLLLTGLILAAMIQAPFLVQLVAPGITDPATFALAVKMTRIILPAQFFFFSGGLLMAIQFAHEKFWIPALAPLIYNGLIICGGLILGPKIGMEGFAWGVLGGAFLGNFLVQLLGAKQTGAVYTPVLGFCHPDLQKYIKLTLPLMLGLTMTFSTEFFLKFFGSFLPQGSIAAMNYDWRVMNVVVGLFGQAVGVASYPYMARFAQSGQIDALNQLLNQTLKFIFLVIPLGIMISVLSHEIILILFQRGQFDAHATRITQEILPFFMVGAFAFSAQTIVSRGYYAIQNTLLPTVLTSGCVILALPITYGLMRGFGAKGLAAGLCLSAVLQSVVLFECWSRQSRNSGKAQVYLFLLKLLPITAGIGLILYFSAQIWRKVFDAMTFGGALAVCILIGLEFLLIFYITGRIFQIHQILTIFENICKRGVSWIHR